MAEQQTTMKKCARAWSHGDPQGRTYRTHMKKCLRKPKGALPGESPAVTRQLKHTKTNRGAKDPCALQCDSTVQHRLDNGDRTPRAVMKASCLRKCHEKGPAAAARAGAAASAPAVVKRDIKAMCARYCDDKSEKAGCVRQCNDGQIGPGRLAAKLVEQKAAAPASLMHRLLKHKARQDQKAAGAARRVSAADKRAARHGQGRADWSDVMRAKKTIGRR